MKSLVLITTDPTTGDLVSAALGHQDLGTRTYVVRLSATGKEPVTHYGCHTWATERFVSFLKACINRSVLPPAPWKAVGLREEIVRTFCAALIWDTQESVDAREHFKTVLTAKGLREIE